MIGKKVKLRFTFLLLVFLTVLLIVYSIIKSLEENIVYFKSPTEIKKLTEISTQKIRVGGMVKKDSIEIDIDQIRFVITDFKNELIVTYSGSVPNLFSEEKGVVAEGFLKDRKILNANRILAKHDENYMPPEVKKALEN
tara:strand:+ start:690 stop:1106 length:417 start_codon:yes stop_codon:yes gene_type:complete